ncbi:MAG: alkaline phosphatase D family protein, partial [Verrucomicrobiales bacterium]
MPMPIDLPTYPLQSPKKTRRSFIGSSASLLAALAMGQSLQSGEPVWNRPSFTSYPFQLGVASGDPSHDGFVIWTRLAPSPLTGGGMPAESVWVHWRVAEDEGMKKVVREGRFLASPEWGHAVHVELQGLKPDRWYHYDFKVGSEMSPQGRTRTLEDPARGAGETSPLKIAAASCQHFETGFFTAYEHMARENVDLVFHLGDYIYEGSGIEGRVRRHLGTEIKTLFDYRLRHAQYRFDPALQEMHRIAPWAVTWDDHEVDNNYAAGISEEEGVRSADFLQRRAAAYQAYYEHMPLRRSSVPRGPDLLLFRRLRHGGLVDFQVLDTRQYRSDQVYGDGQQTPGPEVLRADRTLLGWKQKDWLLGNLENSHAHWNVMAQQVMFAPVNRGKRDRKS